MRRVELARKPIDEYRELIGAEATAEIEELAEPLRGARVLHLNATAHGGGVAELLPTLVGLKRGLGIEAEWYALSGNDAFFELTKKLHNGLQGMAVDISPGLRGLYLSTLEENREAFERDWDYVVVHDPQPAGLIGVLDGRRTGRWLWRCHVDTTSPNDVALDFLAPYMGGFELAIFTLPEYAARKLSPKRSEFVYPSIDPLSPKNQVLANGLSRQILENRFGIDPDRPLMTQVSRYDPWKDPLGVIDGHAHSQHTRPSEPGRPDARPRDQRFPDV
jgi:trehalose synthase